MSHLVRLETSVRDPRLYARATPAPRAVFLVSWVAILALCAAVWYFALTLAL